MICRAAVWLVILAAVSGCASVDPWVAWRGAVEDYVRNHGGDVGALRTVGPSDSPGEPRPGLARFGVLNKSIATPDWTGPADIVGVLAGGASVEGRPWLIYLVGVCPLRPTGAANDEPVVGLHIVAVAVDGQGLAWREGDPSATASARYAAAGRCPTALDARLRFPRSCDDFAVEHAGSTTRVTELRSGAVWQLDFVQPPPSAR